MRIPICTKRWVWKVPAIIAIVVLFSVESKCNLQYPYNKWNKQSNLKAPGPWVLQSRGKIWPKPQLQTEESEIFFTLDSSNFSFKVNYK